jgi:hypothetical protein
MMYSLSSGLPILFQGFLGTLVREMPSVMSFSDYVFRVSRRFCLLCSSVVMVSVALHQTVGHQFESQPLHRIGAHPLFFLLVMAPTHMLSNDVLLNTYLS